MRGWTEAPDRVLCLTLRFAPVLAVLTIVPAVVGFATDDAATGWPLVPAAALALWLSWVTTRRPPPEDASEAEDAVAVALVFPLALLFSSAPYLTHDLGPLDALFEGMSGVTGTGLSRYGAVPGGIEAQPYGLTFLRAWQEWIGGYAIVTLTVALLPRGARGAQAMAESDVADDSGRDGGGSPDLKRRSKQVTSVYAGLTALCVLLVWASGASFGFAVLHGLTAVSTGGFSSLNDSLAGVPGVTVLVLMGFALLGAVSLSDYVRPVTERAGLRKLALTLGALVLLSLLAAGAIRLIEGDAFAAAGLLQVAFSAQTTTGFSALAVAELSDGSKGVLIASMYVGGDLGSTAGGIKLMRFFAIGLAVAAILRPRAGLADPPGDGARGALRLIAWWLGLSVAGWALLSADGHAPLPALFELSSALNNTGLSVGVSGGDAPVSTRVVLILAMWLGRVEILAVALLIRPVLGGLPPR